MADRDLTTQDILRDGSRGARLCETCWDAMTDQVLPSDQTATGLEEACCAACWPVALQSQPVYGMNIPERVEQYLEREGILW